jgi:hypothetical protein
MHEKKVGRAAHSGERIERLIFFQGVPARACPERVASGGRVRPSA